MGRVLIYGGSGGVGGTLARLLAARGYRLHLVARNEERLARLADEIGASFTAGEVSDPSLFDRVARESGDELSGLVYAIGTIRLKALSRLGEADFLEDFRINALGGAKAVQSARPALERGDASSSVVFFSSVAATQGFPLHASMGMAKGAVEGLTLSLAAELAPRVRVNAIAPSLTRTPLAAGLLANQQMADGIAALHPLQRLGTADDIAAAAAFLLSPEASWITGQVLHVDGGRSSLSAKR